MAKQWRCFHCDEVFTHRYAARLHFGPSEVDTPVCQMRDHEGHLAEYIRKLENELSEYRADDSHVLRSMAALEANHARALIVEEEKGYARGVKDGWDSNRDDPSIEGCSEFVLKSD